MKSQQWAAALSGLLFVVVIAIAAAGDDHKPVKVPQPVLKWASGEDVKLAMRANTSAGVMLAKVTALKPDVLSVVEFGETIIDLKLCYDSGKDSPPSLHAAWIDPEWCKREFGHAWERDGGGCDLTLGGYCYGTNDLLYYPNGRPTIETCRICKLKRSRPSMAEWTYEQPKRVQ